jgi:hypothetical protein
VLDGDLVAEEGRCLGAGMRDQGLVLVEFQVEVVTQELGQALLDLLGFGLGPGEPEEVIVGIADISGPPVAGITRVPRGTPRRRTRSCLTARRSPRRQASLIALVSLAYSGFATLIFPRVYSGIRTVSANLSSRSR